VLVFAVMCRRGDEPIGFELVEVFREHFAADIWDRPVQLVAEGSEGFIWRLKDDSNNATSIPVTEDRFLILNLSVWRNIDDRFAYTYRTAHAEYVRRRAEWFERDGADRPYPGAGSESVCVYFQA
jgi:hypothetical protein